MLILPKKIFNYFYQITILFKYYYIPYFIVVLPRFQRLKTFIYTKLTTKIKQRNKIALPKNLQSYKKKHNNYKEKTSELTRNFNLI